MPRAPVVVDLPLLDYLANVALTLEGECETLPQDIQPVIMDLVIHLSHAAQELMKSELPLLDQCDSEFMSDLDRSTSAGSDGQISFEDPRLPGSPLYTNAIDIRSLGEACSPFFHPHSSHTHYDGAPTRNMNEADTSSFISQSSPRELSLYEDNPRHLYVYSKGVYKKGSKWRLGIDKLRWTRIRRSMDRLSLKKLVSRS